MGMRLGDLKQLQLESQWGQK